LVLKGAGRMLSQFRFVKAEAADFESYVGCAKLADLSKFWSRSGSWRSAEEAFASHPDGGQYWDVVWERPAKMALPRWLSRLVGIRDRP
jgi:hypothetical protein